MTIEATGGWCAPGDVIDVIFPTTLPAFDTKAYRQQWPVGGPCANCEGEGTITSGPWCQCPFCEDDIDTDPCGACDGTGVEPDVQLVDLPAGRPWAPLDLPVIAVTRGGIVHR